MQNLVIFFLFTCFWGTAAAQELRDSSIFVVAIDPGHGGRDPGQLSSHAEKYFHEKNIVLPIARKVQTYINERLPNTRAFLTRNADSTVSLASRTWQANHAQADVFVSIHCNSNPLTDIKGTRVHVQSREFKESFRLAKIMRQQFADRARRYDMGIHNFHDRGYNLFVLKYTEMPSVLVEVGFLSHSEEEKYLNSEYGQDIIASAIFRAIREWKGGLKKASP